MVFFHKKNDFYSFVTEGSINSDFVIAVIDNFSETINKDTVLIMDNAPVHRSKKVVEKIEKWEQKGLYLKFIPPYCPELNKIEILWRFIKYYWLPIKAYKNFLALKRNLFKILRNIGAEKYSITFG